MGKKTGLVEQSPRDISYRLSRLDKLLLQCAHIELSEENYQAIREITESGDLDWDSLLEKSRLQRLAPLVSHHLMTPQLKNLVPTHILEKMHSLYYSTLARNMLLQTELSDLLASFHKEGISVIVLKGAALLESIYKDISLRPMIDLDILVRAEQLDRAEAIALGSGYVHVVSDETRDEAKMNWHQLPYLVHHEKKIVLEIHQHFVDSDYPSQFDMKGFWDRAEPLKFYGDGALTLIPEDMLIHLSIKFLLDRRYQSSNALGQLCDISEIIRKYGNLLDWNLISQLADECGIKSGIYFVLSTCKQLLYAPVPEAVLKEFRPIDFSPDMAEIFIQRRVLDSRPWLAHGLADSKVSGTKHNMFHVIVKRFCNAIAGIFKNKEHDEQAGIGGLKRLIIIFLKLSQAVLRPSEFKSDLRLDQWLSRLYHS